MLVSVSKGKQVVCARLSAYTYSHVSSYVLFSIGNIKPLFQAVFANCWKNAKTCNATWIAAVDYMEIVGIIIGQMLVGVLGDWYVEVDVAHLERRV